MDQTNKKMLNTQQEWIKQQQKNVEYPTRMDQTTTKNLNTQQEWIKQQQKI